MSATVISLISSIVTILSVLITVAGLLTKFGRTNATKDDLKEISADVREQCKELKRAIDNQQDELGSVRERIAVVEYALKLGGK